MENGFSACNTKYNTSMFIWYKYIYKKSSWPNITYQCEDLGRICHLYLWKLQTGHSCGWGGRGKMSHHSRWELWWHQTCSPAHGLQQVWLGKKQRKMSAWSILYSNKWKILNITKEHWLCKLFSNSRLNFRSTTKLKHKWICSPFSLTSINNSSPLASNPSFHLPHHSIREDE